MGTVTPIRPNVLPAPFSIYQRKGFVECGQRDDADGLIVHTRKGDKRHYLRVRGRVYCWRRVDAREYLEVMR